MSFRTCDHLKEDGVYCSSSPALTDRRSSRITSERSCTRSTTTSRPSGETSKSRISNSGAKLVNCRSVPVSRLMSQRFLC